MIRAWHIPGYLGNASLDLNVRQLQLAATRTIDERRVPDIDATSEMQQASGTPPDLPNRRSSVGAGRGRMVACRGDPAVTVGIVQRDPWHLQEFAIFCLVWLWCLSAPLVSPRTGASPWDRQENSVVKQADAWFENYKFRDGESIPRLRIHYATLGTSHRNDQGVLVDI